MENATIGDSSAIMYEFDWGDHSRTTDEIGDLSAIDTDCTIEDIVEVAKDDPDCEVSIIGFEK